MADDSSDPPNQPSDHYNVGYRRPPLEHRIKKGERRNPKGRPKGSKNTSKMLDKLLGEQVDLTENGKRRRRTKLEVGLLHHVNKHVQGNARSTEIIFRHWKPKAERSQNEGSISDELSDVEEQIFQNFLARAADKGGSP